MLPFCQLRTARWLAIEEHSSAHKTTYCPTNIEFVDLQQDTLLYDCHKKQQTAVAKQQIQITKEICQEQENAKATLSTSIYTYSIKQKKKMAVKQCEPRKFF